MKRKKYFFNFFFGEKTNIVGLNRSDELETGI